MRSIKNSESFESYSQSEDRFPNATIKSFIRFRENSFNETIETENSINIEVPDIFSLELYVRAKNKKLLEITPEKRNRKERSFAYQRANFECEANCNNALFLNSANNLPYLESHHLIPLEFQSNFNYSLDVFPNIISLCPSCHRKIHFGINEGRINLIKNLLKERQSELKTSGINITETPLFKYYKV